MDDFSSNPLYKDVLDYLAKSHSVQSQPKSNFFDKYALLAIIPLVLLSGVFIGFLIFKPSSQAQKVSTIIPPENAQPKTNTTSLPPLPSYEPNSFTSALILRFTGTLLEIRPHNKGFQLITDIPGAPDMIFSKTIPIFFIQMEPVEAKTPATFNDLKPNQKISVHLIYQDERKEWSVGALRILQ